MSKQTTAEAIAEQAAAAAAKAEQAAREAIEAHGKGDKDAAAEAAHKAAIFADQAAAAALEAYHISGNTCDTPESKAAGDAAERASIASSKAINAFYDIAERAETAELAAVEAAAPEALANEGNPEDAINLIAYTAFADINDGATPDTYDDNDMEQLDRLMEYAAEIVRRDGPVNGIQWTPYQRHELEAFLGEYVDAYDVDAIEAEATTYDPKTGRAVWTPEAVRDLATIAERHEITA